MAGRQPQANEFIIAWLTGTLATPPEVTTSLAVGILEVEVLDMPPLPAGNAEIGIVQVRGERTNTATAVAATTQDTSADVILAANLSRKGFIIQNRLQTVIYLGFGATPTSSAYHVALKACTADNDGTGGVWIDDKWVGAVSAISSGASGGVAVTEFT